MYNSYENNGLGGGRPAYIMDGREKQNQMNREFQKIKSVFPDSKTAKLYQLCEEKGVQYIAEQYMFSLNALTIILNEYQSDCRKKENMKKMKNKKEQQRLFSKSEIVTDIKYDKETNNIIVLYANNIYKTLNKKEYYIVKDEIIKYGKHIVQKIETEIMDGSDKKKIENAKDSKMRTINRIMKSKTILLEEERELYLKWKFYFEHYDMIDSISKYKVNRELKVLLQGRNITFKKLNSPVYTYKKIEADYDIAVKMYSHIQENESELVQTLQKMK